VQVLVHGPFQEANRKHMKEPRLDLLPINPNSLISTTSYMLLL
jgi:hypothetical protein